LAESKRVWLTELGHGLAKAIEVADTFNDQKKKERKTYDSHEPYSKK